MIHTFSVLQIMYTCPNDGDMAERDEHRQTRHSLLVCHKFVPAGSCAEGLCIFSVCRRANLSDQNTKQREEGS